MKLRTQFVALLAVAALVLSPAAANAGSKEKPGGGNGGGDNVHKCQGSRNCTTTNNVLSNFTLVNTNLDRFDVSVFGDRALSNNEITLIKGDVNVLNVINSFNCNSLYVLTFNGTNCSKNVAQVIADTIDVNIATFVLNKVKVKLTTVAGNVFVGECGCK